MAFYYRMFFFLLMPLFLFYEINQMYPKDPIVQLPLPIIGLCFFIVLIAALVNNQLLSQNYLIKSFLILEVLMIFVSYEHSLFCPLRPYSSYLTILFPFLFFLFSYKLTKMHGGKYMLLFVSGAVLVLSVVYLFNRNNTIEEMLRTDAGSYTILYFVPFVLCFKQKLLRFLFLTICVVTVFLSFKRGGIICVFCGVYVYFIISALLSKGEGKVKKIIGSFFPLVFFIFMLVYFNDIYDDSIFSRFSKIEEAGGSGRDEIYIQTIDMIRNSNGLDLFFGHGWNSVQRDSRLGLSAHNDFLECVYDYGIFVFGAYIILYVNFIRFLLKLIKNKSFFAAPLAASIAMFLSNSLVSHILLYERFLVIFALFWGFLLAEQEREQSVIY